MKPATTKIAVAVVAGGLLLGGTATTGWALAGHSAPAAPARTATPAPAKATPKPPARPPAKTIYVAPPPKAPARVLPGVPVSINPPEQDAVRPAQIGLSEDGNGWLHGLNWSSWTPASASGTGYINIDNGSPNMEQGTTVNVTVSVVLSRPTVSDHPVFTRLAVTDGKGHSDTYAYADGAMESTSLALSQADKAPPAQAPPAQAPPAQAPPTPTPAQTQPYTGDPVAGSGTGPACTTIAGYFPGGEPGHEDSTGFCVPDS